MSHRTAYASEGKLKTIERQRVRRAVATGRAQYLPTADILAMRKALQAHLEARREDERPTTVVEVRQPQTPPVKHERKRFGEGLGERHPVYRLPGRVTCEDITFWEAEAQREYDREIDRMAERAAAEARWDGWY